MIQTNESEIDNERGFFFKWVTEKPTISAT